MEPIADNLVRVLDAWSDSESGTLNRGQSLGGLWDQRHLGAIPYDPDGIDRLISRVRSNNFFKADAKFNVHAGALGHGMFVAGGGIQTEGDLFDFLAS
jgi:hypothetical protein